MSPRTRVLPLLVVIAGALLSACGEPPRPLPTSPPYVTPSAAPLSLGPSLDPALPTAPTQPLPTQPLPTQPVPTQPVPTQPLPTGQATYPTAAVPTQPRVTTTAPDTVPATPTPAHAARCATQPTGAQILTLIKGKPGVPNRPMRIYEGPFCSGTWAFATVEVTGENADDLEPLMVVATGSGATLALVAAGSDVCTDRVQTAAPSGIRVLACGF